MTTTMERVAAYRSRQRDRGLREVRMWLPDTRTARFAAEAEAACQRMNKADAEDGIEEFLEHTAIDDGLDQW